MAPTADLGHVGVFHLEKEHQMPKNIGRYEQGGMTTQPNFQPHEAGVPNRAKPAGSVPRGEQHQKAEHGIGTANDVKPH